MCSAPLLRSLRLQADRLDVVAVGIHDEGGVVIRAVVLADARASVVAATGVERRLVEGFDSGTGGRRERDVQGGLVRMALRDPERRSVLGAEPGSLVGFVEHLVPERGEGALEELPAPCCILDLERDVVVHRGSSSRASCSGALYCGRSGLILAKIAVDLEDALR